MYAEEEGPCSLQEELQMSGDFPLSDQDSYNEEDQNLSEDKIKHENLNQQSLEMNSYSQENKGGCVLKSFDINLNSLYILYTYF